MAGKKRETLKVPVKRPVKRAPLKPTRIETPGTVYRRTDNRKAVEENEA